MTPADGANTRSTPSLRRDLQVCALVHRIAVQVGRLAELGRVDEQAHHDRVASLSCAAEQRAMAAVQRPHRRDEPDPAVAPVDECGADVLDAAGDDHRAAPRARLAGRQRCEGVIGIEQLGSLGRDRRAMALDRLPVAALDRPGQLEAVLDHAPHQRARAPRRERRPRRGARRPRGGA